MNPNHSESEFIRVCRKPIENLKIFGIMVPGGDMPDLSVFLHNAGIFIQACKADLDYHEPQ